MAKKVGCPVGYKLIKDAAGNNICVKPKTVYVYTEGGLVNDVINLPKGHTYAIRDWDEVKAGEMGWAGIGLTDPRYKKQDPEKR